MKRDLEEITDKMKSPYSLKRNNFTRRTLKSKLNEGLIFIQKAPKINRLKNFYVMMRKNSILILSIGLTLYIYYLYLFFYICEILYSSNVGLDLRFWFYLGDQTYRKAFASLILFHVLFMMFIYSMLKVLFSDPGFIDQKYIDLYSLLPKEMNQILSDEIKCKEIQKLHDAIMLDESNNTFIQTVSFEEFEKLVSVTQEIKPENFENFLTKDFFYKILYFTRYIQKDICIKNRMHCIFCLYIRPERSHHCKKCRKCILKMDHHCDILNNCIGYYNYNLYMTFLFYSNFLLLYIFIIWIDMLIHYFTFYGWDDSRCKIITFSSVLIFICFVSVADLFIIHLTFLARGVTTIENSGNIIENLCSEDSKKSCWENIREIMGDNPIFWFIPKVRERKIYDGYIYYDDNKEFLKNKITEIHSIIRKELNKCNEESFEQNYLNDNSIREPI